MESNQERNSTYEVRYRAKVTEGAVGEHRQQHTQQKNTSQFIYRMEAMPQDEEIMKPFLFVFAHEN